MLFASVYLYREEAITAIPIYISDVWRIQNCLYVSQCVSMSVCRMIFFRFRTISLFVFFL